MTEINKIPYDKFKSMLGCIAKVCDKDIDETTYKTYFDAVNHIDVSRLIPALAHFLAESKWPSAKYICEKAGVKIADPESAFKPKFKTYLDGVTAWRSDFCSPIRGPRPDEQSLAFRLCLPFSDCCNLEASVRFWKNSIKELQEDFNWQFIRWAEYNGVGNFNVEAGGKMVTHTERIYYAVAIAQRYKGDTSGCMIVSELTDDPNGLAGSAIDMSRRRIVREPEPMIISGRDAAAGADV